MKLSKLVNSLALPNLSKYFSPASQAINLTVGEPDFDLDSRVMKKLSTGKARHKYSSPYGLFELREQIAKQSNKEIGTKYSVDKILITLGSSSALMLALQAIIDPGDEVIVFEPYFPPYLELIRIAGAKTKIVTTYPSFIPSAKQLERAVTKRTKAIIVNSPNNPTGAIYDKKTIHSLVDFAKKHSLYIVSDEVYRYFDYDKTFASPAKYYDKTIVINSFSKSHAATGLRLGYLAANKDIVDAAKQLLFLQQVCLPEIIQEAFMNNLEPQKTSLEIYRKNRDVVSKILAEKLAINKPGGFYFFVRTKNTDEPLVKKLSDEGVLVMPGSLFGSDSHYLRISLIADTDKLSKACQLIQSLDE